MNYKDKSESILQQLNSYKTNVSLTDANDKQINFAFKLSKHRPAKEIPFAEIKDENDYSLIINYIIKELDYPNFIFSSDEFDSLSKFLTVVVVD